MKEGEVRSGGDGGGGGIKKGGEGDPFKIPVHCCRIQVDFSCLKVVVVLL